MAVRAFVTDWADPPHRPRHADPASVVQRRALSQSFAGAATRVLEQPTSRQIPGGEPETTLSPSAAEAGSERPAAAFADANVGGEHEAAEVAPNFDGVVEALPQVIEQARALAQRLEELGLQFEAARVRSVWRDLDSKGRRWNDELVAPHLAPHMPDVRPWAGASLRGAVATPRRDEARDCRWQTMNQSFHKHPAELSRVPAFGAEGSNVGASGVFYPKRRGEQVNRNGEFRIATLNPGR